MPQEQRHISKRNLRTYGSSRAVRLADCDYRDDIDIHVTVCADNGDPFRDDRVARVVTENVEHYCRALEYRLYGYCLMPDHLHVLLSPADSGAELRDWLKRFKGFTSRECGKLGTSGPLWQRSAHDHICRRGETAETVLDYIVNNPVRGGLVEKWEDWPWTKVFMEL